MQEQKQDNHLPPEVHSEREKTKRTLIIATAITLVGSLATVLFFQNIDNRGGALKVSEDGVEVTLERPIATQLGAASESVKAFGDSITFTTGTISDSAVKAIPGVRKVGSFSGQNLIDTKAGFVLSSDRPSTWQLDTLSATVQRLRANDGSTITVEVRKASSGREFDAVVQRTLDSLRSAGTTVKSRIDTNTNSVLLWYRNAQSQQTTCKKFLSANDKIYVVTATTQDPNSVTSLVRSVSGFTAIETKAKKALSVPATKPPQQ